MQERKKLKTSGEIISGYIEFPATLMVKKPGESKYVVKAKF